MGSKNTKDIEAALTKKGFVHTKSSHHHFLVLYVDGEKKSIFTRYSHGKKECGDNLIGLMACQIRLSKAQFNDFIDCQLSEERYLDILSAKGILKK